MVASTRKVVIGTASLIAGQCLLAGFAMAAELNKLTGGESVETILAAVAALCIGVLGTALAGARLIVKAAKQETDNPVWQLFANQVNRDTDIKTLLKDIVETTHNHEQQLKPLVEDYMMRKAKRQTGRPWED